MDLLTQAERDRFAAYAAFEATSYAELAEQMKKLPVPAAVREHTKLLSTAYRIVADHLAKGERTEIGGKPETQETPKTGE